MSRPLDRALRVLYALWRPLSELPVRRTFATHSNCWVAGSVRGRWAATRVCGRPLVLFDQREGGESSVADKRQLTAETKGSPPVEVVVSPMVAVSVEDARKIVGAKNCLATCSG
jgi:hypothetical protein